MRQTVIMLALVTFALVMPATALDLNKGLVAYYSFDDVQGKILKDDSGNGHDGIIYGNPKIVDGIKGKALEFDGIYSQYVRIPNDDVFNSEIITLSVWIKSFGDTSNYRCIISNEEENAEIYGHWKILWPLRLMLWKGTGYPHFDFTVNNRAKEDYIEIPKNLHDSKFHNIVVVRDGLKLKMYLDGEKIIEKLYLKPVDSSMADLMIGLSPYQGQSKYGSYPFKGVIDEIRIYNRALSDEEIKALYEQTLHPTPTQPPTPKPKLTLTINCDSLLKQGEIRTAELTVENVGNANAKDITVTIISPSLGINVQKSYDLIPPNEARTISFKVSPNEAGKFTIKAMVEYWDDKGNKYIETTEKTLTVEATEIITETTLPTGKGVSTPDFTIPTLITALAVVLALRRLR